MPDRLKTIGAALGYSAWFLLLFVMLTWLTFPWGRVRDQAMVQASESGWALQIDSLGSAFVGLKAKGLSLGLAGADGEPAGAPLITLDKVKVKTGLAGAAAAGMELRAVASEGGATVPELVQRVLAAVGSVDGKAKLYGGKLNLTLSDQGEATRFAWNAEKLDLSKYLLELESVSAEPEGKLRSTADVSWHWEDPKKTTGSIDLNLDSLTIRKLKVGIITAPELVFSQAEAHLKFARGKAEFRDTVFEAEQAQARIEGFVSLSQNFMRSRLSLRVKFKLADTFDGLMSMAVGSDPTHKDKDGWYHYQINGTLQRPRLRPSPAAARGGRRSGGAPTRSVDIGDDDDDDDDKPGRRKPRRSTSSRDDNGKIERGQLTDEEQAEREAARERLREERMERREQRRKRREELMRQRRERQANTDAPPEPVNIGTAVDGELLQIPPEDEFIEEEGEFLEPELEGDEGEFEGEPFEDDLEPLEEYEE